jgi:hypothetical protein
MTKIPINTAKNTKIPISNVKNTKIPKKIVGNGLNVFDIEYGCKKDIVSRIQSYHALVNREFVTPKSDKARCTVK